MKVTTAISPLQAAQPPLGKLQSSVMFDPINASQVMWTLSAVSSITVEFDLCSRPLKAESLTCIAHSGSRLFTQKINSLLSMKKKMNLHVNATHKQNIFHTILKWLSE